MHKVGSFSCWNYGSAGTRLAKRAHCYTGRWTDHIYYTYVQATESYKAGDDNKISEAVQNLPKKAEEQVVKRNIMNTKKLITEWSLQAEKATIVSGRYSAGKTVAVNEALRGVRGVFQFDVESAGWKEAMYKKLRVNDEGMFKEVLRRVRRELERLPDNPTKFPILLLEVWMP
eukprot:s3283_g6.t1